jgi:hypothetical protein
MRAIWRELSGSLYLQEDSKDFDTDQKTGDALYGGAVVLSRVSYHTV